MKKAKKAKKAKNTARGKKPNVKVDPKVIKCRREKIAQVSIAQFLAKLKAACLLGKEGKFCYNVDSRKKLKCTCLSSFVTLCESRSNHDEAATPGGTSLSVVYKLWLELHNKHANPNFSKKISFLTIMATVSPKIRAGDGSGQSMFHFGKHPDHEFCATGLQNMLGYDKRLREDFMDQLYKNKKLRNKLIRTAILNGLIQLKIDDPEYKKNLTKRQVFEKLTEITQGNIVHSSFNDNYCRIQKFLDQKDFQIAHPALCTKHNVLADLKGKVCTTIDPDSGGPGSIKIVHQDNLTTMRLPPELFPSFLENLVVEFKAAHGFNGKDLTAVNSATWTKYESTFAAGMGMSALIQKHLKPMKGASESQKKHNMHLLEQGRTFDIFLVKTVLEHYLGEYAGLYTITYDAGYMLTSHEGFHPPKGFQSPHMDFHTKELLTYLEAGHKMLVAFMPLEMHGMWLSYYEKFCHSGEDVVKVIFIPYGSIAFAPASLIHAGGYRTSLTGNKRCHFYIYCALKSARRGPICRGNGNFYMKLSEENRATIFKRDSQFYSGVIEAADEEFLI